MIRLSTLLRAMRDAWHTWMGTVALSSRDPHAGRVPIVLRTDHADRRR